MKHYPTITEIHPPPPPHTHTHLSSYPYVQVITNAMHMPFSLSRFCISLIDIKYNLDTFEMNCIKQDVLCVQGLVKPE